MNVLEEIVAHKREEVSRQREAVPVAQLEKPAALREHRSFAAALQQGARPRIIAELKKASPSKGILRQEFDVDSLARGYQLAGAAALSILTDRRYFQGDLAFLEQARRVTELPLLRKDFIVDDYQVVESAAAGADAILLIVAALPVKDIQRLTHLAEQFGLDVLVEVHDPAEAEVARASGARLIGVNNRDLKTFEVTLETSRVVAGGLPAGGAATLVSESGIFSAEDLARLESWGYEAFLIGEAFLKQPDPGAALGELISEYRAKKVAGRQSPVAR
ncbi:MAG: indole-3-glycerol phosphate synthase TrpC [Acidobacteriota bacterium]